MAGSSVAYATIAAAVPRSRKTEPAVQQLRWRSFAICQNFSNRRRKVIDAGTGHNNAVAAAVSFLGDAQKSSAVILPELHVEMLALDLQFSRLDDVIHFLPKAADFTASALSKGSKICRFLAISSLRGKAAVKTRITRILTNSL